MMITLYRNTVGATMTFLSLWRREMLKIFNRLSGDPDSNLHKFLVEAGKRYPPKSSRTTRSNAADPLLPIKADNNNNLISSK